MCGVKPMPLFNALTACNWHNAVQSSLRTAEFMVALALNEWKRKARTRALKGAMTVTGKYGRYYVWVD